MLTKEFEAGPLHDGSGAQEYYHASQGATDLHAGGSLAAEAKAEAASATKSGG